MENLREGFRFAPQLTLGTECHQAGTFLPMAIPKSFGSLAGSWIGSNLVHLPWLPEGQQVFESTSTVELWVSAGQEIATARYSWAHEGNAHHGVIVIAADGERSTVGWSDSWHQNGSVLAMAGAHGEDLDVSAAYASDENGDWRWRIKLLGSEEGLILEMFNINPAGEETWAVRSNYTRRS